MEFFFMRHGRSCADDEGVYGGRYDDPLTDIGRRQAMQRAELLQSENFTCDKIIASPLKRAAQTADILAEALQVPVEYNQDWMERDNGPLAGMTFEEGCRAYPVPEFKSRFKMFVPGQGGESEFDLHCRAWRALGGLVALKSGNYLVVAHGGILNAVMRCIIGAQPPVNQAYGVFFSFGDTGYIHVSYQPNREHWRFRQLVPGL
jgi:2,3-bisphosphoglycerate-dependent phosphoglycerate mutase